MVGNMNLIMEYSTRGEEGLQQALRGGMLNIVDSMINTTMTYRRLYSRRIDNCDSRIDDCTKSQIYDTMTIYVLSKY